uniref:Uncharacterized protein n=1 Tax=Glossina brevipalpis TaxID=37001 RepID=A0A1A9WN49_9MUSC
MVQCVCTTVTQTANHFKLYHNSNIFLLNCIGLIRMIPINNRRKEFTLVENLKQNRKKMQLPCIHTEDLWPCESCVNCATESIFSTKDVSFWFSSNAFIRMQITFTVAFVTCQKRNTYSGPPLGFVPILILTGVQVCNCRFDFILSLAKAGERNCANNVN